MKKLVKILLALSVAALAAIYGKTIAGFLKGLASKKEPAEEDIVDVVAEEVQEEE